MFNDKIKTIRDDIKTAARKVRRDPGSVRLICVTKEASIKAMLGAISYGIKDIGENRVKEAVIKYAEIGDTVKWHLIGHLQTNKVKDALRIFSLIHSVDSLKLAQTIQKEALKISKCQDILIEVNVSGEGSKFGIAPNELNAFLTEIKGFSNINVRGLMTVTPFSDRSETSRPYFRSLKKLADLFGLKELSMGMTQDYRVAIEEGATMIRVGRAIFQAKD